MLKGFKEAPVLGGGSLCRMVPLLYAERIEGGPYAEMRPSAAERRPCVAQRRPLCREEAPVPRGGPGAERRPSVPKCILC